MSRTEFMRQLESLLQNISATEREEALQYYNEYFNDAGPENEQNVIEALGNPAKVAENIKKDIFGNGYGENLYQKMNADHRAIIPYPAEDGAEGGTQEQNARQSGAQNGATQTVNAQKKEGMSTGMIVLIVLLCIVASPVILGVASAGIGVAAGLIATWIGLIVGFGATAIALILVLIALVVVGIISMVTNPFHLFLGMELIGAGLICGGVGLLFLMLTVAMAGIATPAICHWIGGLFQKRGKANA